MTLTAALLLAVSGAAPILQVESHDTPPPRALSIGTDQSARYRPGDSVRTTVRVAPGSYLTVLRVDTEGRIRILYPTYPDAGGFVSLTASRTLPATRLAPFRAGPRPGVGYLAAFVSEQPFDYRSIVQDGRWDQSPGARTRIVGDPVAGLVAFMRPLAAAIAFDVVPYHVGGTFDYPRFACSGCHAPTADWDPYQSRCRLMSVSGGTAMHLHHERGAAVRSVRAVPRLIYRPLQADVPQSPAQWSGLRAIHQPTRTVGGAEATGRRPTPSSTGRPRLLRRRAKTRLPSGPSGETRLPRGPYH